MNAQHQDGSFLTSLRLCPSLRWGGRGKNDVIAWLCFYEWKESCEWVIPGNSYYNSADQSAEPSSALLLGKQQLHLQKQARWLERRIKTGKKGWGGVALRTSRGEQGQPLKEDQFEEFSQWSKWKLGWWLSGRETYRRQRAKDGQFLLCVLVRCSSVGEEQGTEKISKIIFVVSPITVFVCCAAERFSFL